MVNKAKALSAMQWLFMAAVIIAAIIALRTQWDAISEQIRSTDVLWTPVVVSSLIVFITYALLIECWRQVIQSLKDTLQFASAARIWFASNLGKYLPGKVWSIAAMGMMAKGEGVSPFAAGGSAIVMQLASIAAGTGVILVLAADLLDYPLLIAAAAVLLIAIPYLLPIVAGWFGREVPRIPMITLALAIIGSVVSWILYGIAFQMFSSGVLGGGGDGGGGVDVSQTGYYIAVYAASYILGLVAVFAPGGIGVREAIIIALMPKMGLATPVQAAIVALGSRLWLTVLEIVPGLIALTMERCKKTPKN